MTCRLEPGAKFLAKAPWFVNGFVGGWTVTGVIRLLGGNPFQPFLTDPNHLGGAGLNRIVRPDIVSGVPLKNPLWSKNCTIGNACEPFINPAAFMRPVKGQLGNSPRSISVRPPRQEYYDFSLSKQFPWPFASGEGKRRIDFRIDLINAFNHPNFRLNNLGNTPFGLGTFPTELTTEAREWRDPTNHCGGIQYLGYIQQPTIVYDDRRGGPACRYTGNC